MELEKEVRLMKELTSANLKASRRMNQIIKLEQKIIEMTAVLNRMITERELGMRSIEAAGLA